ncbi:MAG: hypothetical protein K2L46_02085, partial [Paramuribaculum sp.]|nr:hypothetical protein [Paramuribaculum sp.]
MSSRPVQSSPSVDDANVSATVENPHQPKPKRSFVFRFLKWISVAVVSGLLLVALLLTAVVWVLTPERLTPIVNRYASEYLLADVDARKIELTFWSTFPRFSVEVDSLSLRSRVADSFPDSVRSALPEGVDSLLFVERFAGGINLMELVKGNIELYDVGFRDIRANIVQIDSLTANYAIVPPSEKKADEGDHSLPDISINRFSIDNGLSVRYRSLQDSIYAKLKMDRVALADTVVDKPFYNISLSGDVSASLIPLTIPSIPFALDGKIAWSSRRPMEAALSDFSVSAGEVKTVFSADVDFADSVKIKTFTFDLPDVEVLKILKLAPDGIARQIPEFDSDVRLRVGVKFIRPYVVGGRQLPLADVSVRISGRKFRYDRLDLSRLEADIDARIDASNPDASVVEVKELAVKGKAMEFKLDGTISNPVTDPRIEAMFEGELTVQNLPAILLDRLPCVVRGVLHGRARVASRLSYFNPKKFHKVRIDGDISLRDFRMAMTDGSLESYIRNAELKLGSNSALTIKDHIVDSLLTASLTIDTIALLTPDARVCGSAFKAGVGSRNTAASADTSQINPVGASIKAGLLVVASDSDSINIRLRVAEIAASLQRYEGKARSPLMKALVKAAALRYSDRYNRLAVRDTEIDLVMHPKAAPVMSERRRRLFDSIAAAHPDLSTDSVMGLIRQDFRRRLEAYDSRRSGREDLDLELDNSLIRIMRRWNAAGAFKARRARLFTPYFPSRNTLTNLDLRFSTDSVELKDTKLKMNRSDFLLNGSLHNLRRALVFGHGQPIKFDFSVRSDTIDVNDLTATMLRGAVFADRISAGTMKMIEVSGDGVSDDVLQSELDNEVSDTARAAVLVPSNLQGTFSLNAKKVRYADLWLNGLDGLVEVYDGAINMDRLRATTSVGAVNFSALYSAPTVDRLSIAAAVQVRRLNLRSVLDMMPGVDSILPLLTEVRGIVNTDMAMTADLDSMMNLKLESLNLALKISGDSLQLMDNETFRTVAKWMLFKQKQKNMIDHMDVEVAIHDGFIDLYPFIFDMDRYRLGVRGSTDAAFNLDYHVAVIKSPVPFRFGINIKGTPENMKIRLGKARINEKTVAGSRQITDTVRVNLIKEITQVFRRGVRATGSRGLRLQDSRKAGSGAGVADTSADIFTHADS